MNTILRRGLVVLLALCAPALAQLQPQIPIPARPLLFELDAPAPVAVLTGLDLAQQDRPLTGAPPQIQEGPPLSVRLYWHCRSIVEEAEVHLRIEGAGPTFHAAHPIVATNWQVGGVYPAVYQLPLPRLRYSGVGTLRISIEAGEREKTLYAMPVFVAPTAAPSPVQQAEITAFFGEGLQRLEKAFRLGPGASLKLPFESRGIARIGLISGVHHDPTLKQNEFVAVLRLYREGEAVAELPVHAGQDTAAANYDYYRPGYIEAEPIEVFSTRPAGGKNADGEPYEILIYSAEIPLPEPVEADALEIEYLRKTGLLEALDVVL